MRHGFAHGRWGRAKAAGVIGAVAASLVLAGCTSDAGGSAGGSSDDGGAPATPAAATISVDPAQGQSINPVKPVVVKAEHGTLSDVTMTNAKKGTHVTGKFSADKTSWTSTEPLAYAATYNIAAHANGDGVKSADKQTSVSTIKPKNLTYPSLIPPPGNSDVGVGQPLVVRFDEDIPDRAKAERSLKVVSDPPQEGSWYWLNNKEAHYRPKDYWKPGTDIKLHVGVYGKDLGAGLYGESDRDIELKVHDSWIAKANGANQQMAIYHNGSLVKTMPISMGKEDTPTHVGTHVISDKDRVYTMDSCTYGVCSGPDSYRSDEYYSMRISNDGEFVHENPNSVADQGNTNVSHGCINLNESNAAWFFDHFNLGDVVEVVNSGGPQLPIYDTYGDWELSWAQWQQGSQLN